MTLVLWSLTKGGGGGHTLRRDWKRTQRTGDHQAADYLDSSWTTYMNNNTWSKGEKSSVLKRATRPAETAAAAVWRGVCCLPLSALLEVHFALTSFMSSPKAFMSNIAFSLKMSFFGWVFMWQPGNPEVTYVSQVHPDLHVLLLPTCVRSLTAAITIKNFESFYKVHVTTTVNWLSTRSQQLPLGFQSPFVLK